MQITFCGAAGTVTGSSYLIESERGRFLIDCGMFQGQKEIRELNRRDFLFNPGSIDFILLTHSHVDHCGLLPRLAKLGFKGPIYATKAAVELAQIVLLDSGHIQEMESEWRTRKQQRSGMPAEEPLYGVADVQRMLPQFKPVQYRESFEPASGIRVTYQDAGHILGSAIIEVVVSETAGAQKIVFSGDLGQKDQPIIEDPTFITEADYVLIESTYGNRLHEEQTERVEMLRKIIMDSIRGGGNLIIPAFAVGRTQDLLYHIKTLLRNGAIPQVPVYIDSPMAVSVTEVYRNNPECYDEQARELFRSHESPFEFSNLHFIRTTDESKQLNETAKGAIIISANGMCEAGRILHHLKHNLWRPQSHILFVGYQAEGTLGRRLLEGAKVVKIMGEVINVQAQIHSIGGFSAHADQKGLLEWLAGFTKKPRNLFIVHGENGAQQEFAAIVQRQLEMQPVIPRWGERFDLAAPIRQEQVATGPALANYGLEKTVNDLEHSVMALHNQIKRAELQNALPDLETIRRQISALEELLKNPA